MIIKTNPVGQLANRIYDFSTFIAFSIENKERLVYPFFNEFKEYFLLNESVLLTKKIWLVDKPWKLKGFKLFIRMLNFLRNNGSNISSIYHNSSVLDISDLKTKTNFSLFEGGWYINYNSFVKNEEILKSTFTIKEPYARNVKNVIEPANLKYDILVGVHIRRGDYKDFLGGKFYFEDDIYVQKMNLFQSFFRDKKIGFLICSNQEINYNNFSEFDIVKPTNFFIEDLYCLASCDYLLGPPSTFTMWASFYGNTPLYKIHSKEDIFELKDFVVTKEY
jgi:hypothetical protein